MPPIDPPDLAAAPYPLTAATPPHWAAEGGREPGPAARRERFNDAMRDLRNVEFPDVGPDLSFAPVPRPANPLAVVALIVGGAIAGLAAMAWLVGR